MHDDMRARRQVFHAYDPVGNSGSAGMRFCPRCAAPCASGHAGGRARPVCSACTYVHFRNPAPGVSVAVRDGQRVLLGKRIERVPFGGKWGLPAGFIEFDEDFLSAAHREVKEETGLDIEITGILNVTSNYLSDQLHSLVIALAAQPVGGQLAAGDDFSEVEWLPLAGPFPPLAYHADAHLLQLLHVGTAPPLPVDARYGRGQPRAGQPPCGRVK